MLLLQSQVLLVEGVDTIDHGLNQLNFRVAQTVLVGNVISDASLATRFTTGATGLESQLLAPGLQSGQTLLGPSGQVNVDRSPHASSQVGGARVEVAKTGIQQEFLSRLGLDRVTNSLDAPGQTVKDATDVSTFLHGNDTELILLVDPGEEGLGSVVEDTSALRPVTLHTSSDQVFVARDKEEVVINQLLSVFLGHAQEREVFSGQLTRELAKCTLHQSLDSQPLLLGDSRGQAESVNAATNTDPGGVDWGLGVNVALDLADVHVRSVAEALGQAVVLDNDGVEDILEHVIGVLVTGVDAAVLVVELNSAGNGLAKSETSGWRLQTSQFGPFGFCDVFGNQAVCGPDVGEWRSSPTFGRN